MNPPNSHARPPASVNLSWRMATADDIPKCLAVNSGIPGHEFVGHSRASRAWKVLMQFPGAFVVIESPRPIGGHRVIAFGASTFVTQTFADLEISDPKPGLNARIIASVDAGRPVVLTQAELRYANTYSGLNLVVLAASWRRNLLTAEQINEVKMHLAESFLQLHCGYRLVRIISEATDTIDIEHGHSTGVHRQVSDFEEFHKRNPGNCWNKDRALFVLDRESAFAVTASIASILFHYREPVLGLRNEDQQLLAAALRGLTDEELSSTLSLNVAAVKKRWAAVFARVAAAKPGLLPELIGSRHTRGRQKRHRLLAYLREHPEELRPVMRPGPAP